MTSKDNLQLYNDVIPIFVIGAMKCGTTSIFRQLQIRSDICFPPKKEPGYFCEKMGHPEFRKHKYSELFVLNNHHKFIFDGSANYTKYPYDKDVPKRIFEYGLRPRFIYLVRNPFDRIESHYNYMKKDINWKTKITSKYLVDISNYYIQLEQYRNYFNKEDILILDFDDLKNNHEKLFFDLYQHIDIKYYKLDEKFLKSNVTKPVNRTEVKLKKKFNGNLNFIPKPIKEIGKSIFFKKKKKKLTDKEKSFVYDELKNDMQKFKSEYNFPVDKWGF